MVSRELAHVMLCKSCRIGILCGPGIQTDFLGWEGCFRGQRSTTTCCPDRLLPSGGQHARIIHTYIHTNICTCIHTYTTLHYITLHFTLHYYIHTCIHTDIYTITCTGARCPWVLEPRLQCHLKFQQIHFTRHHSWNDCSYEQGPGTPITEPRRGQVARHFARGDA